MSSCKKASKYGILFYGRRACGIKNSAVSLILEAVDPQEIEEIKIQFLDERKADNAIKETPNFQRKIPDVGRLANEVKKPLKKLLRKKTQL